jgi:hypothetical protein
MAMDLVRELHKVDEVEIEDEEEEEGFGMECKLSISSAGLCHE